MADREKRSATIAIRRGTRRPGSEGEEVSPEAETVPRNPTVRETQIPQSAQSSVDTFSNVQRIVEEKASEKLSTSPLSVLLPKLSSVSSLHFHRGALENRLESLIEAQGGQQSSETAMLGQVINWLTLDGGDNG